MRVFAIDHRVQLEEMADEAGAPRERIGAFKRSAVGPPLQVQDGRPGFGILLRRQLRPRGAVPRRRATASGSAGRSKAGLAPAELEPSSAATAARAARMAA